MTLNLSKRITLLIMVLIAVVSLGLGITAIKLSSDAVRTEVENALLLLAEEADDYIEARIQGSLDVLETIANYNAMRSMDWEEQKETLALELERLHHRGYLGMGIVFPNGTAKYSDDSEAELGDREYVRKAFRGESNVSDVIISRVTNSAVLMYAVPIYSFEGEIEGVLIARLPASSINDVTDRMGFGENGYAYVLGADGTIYAHPNRENVMNQRNIFEDIESDGVFKNVGLAIRDLELGKSSVIHYEASGSPRYMGISTIDSTGWVVGIGAHEGDVLAGLNNLRNIIFIIALIVMAIGMAVAIILGKSISKPIMELDEIIERLAKYDLTLDDNSKVIKYLNRKDEIGTISIALTTMQKNFVALIKAIGNTAQQVASSSEELTATSHQSATAADEVARTIEEIAQGAGDQAKDTENGVEHINELGKLLEKEQQYIEDLNISANEVTRLKDEGFVILKDLVEKTEISNKSAKEIHDVIINTDESATKIENASKMIKNIAEQTNLLALNAAIEAARAGEAGRGFAVVAEEIRKLAEESNKFTEEIAGIIKELTDKTEYAVNTMEEVGKTVASQTQSVKLTNDKFKGIDSAIEAMKGIIVQINESSQVMEGKKSEMIGIIENLSAISQENAAGTEEASAAVEEQTASMEEIASASETLAQLAEEMQENIARFKY
ncbi:methyl-accepting chemotaxis protein [Natronincola ferrireducens]|uniref:Methyl-accepting chemotaxis sensory transducer with Cache sensor n=1 Tax=Natronincola ferrireducens TaxID=393762 RepID=A0A1G8YF00_9FIRM|nr:methyl-accepting chemotaxis protein [Natronincola ferrireducens]SDK01306.1 methyl-accepting chemotaxis sensory transducer with Cache sensor [Natronincola ferrireducens]